MSQLINFFVGGTTKVLASGPKRRRMCLTGPLMLSDLPTVEREMDDGWTQDWELVLEMRRGRPPTIITTSRSEPDSESPHTIRCLHGYNVTYSSLVITLFIITIYVYTYICSIHSGTIQARTSVYCDRMPTIRRFACLLLHAACFQAPHNQPAC